MATVSEQIQLVYIGLLGRAADKEGLAYWALELESGALTIEQLRANIVNEQPEYINGQGSMTRAQAVTDLYLNLFKREPDAEGLQYWVSGGGAGVNADQLVLALINGASTADRQVLDNKAEAANYYTSKQAQYEPSKAQAAVAGVDGSQASVEAAKAAIDGISDALPYGGTFTLKEVIETVVTPVEPVTQTVTYWGYNPHPHGETGVDNTGEPNTNNLTNEGPADGGVPLSELIMFIQNYADLDFVQLGLINVASGLNDESQGADFSIDNIADITFEQIDGDGNVVITFTNSDGEVAQAEAALGQMYFDFINGLLFDAEGNTRLYEKTVVVTPMTQVVDALGNPVFDVDGNPVLARMTQVENQIFKPIVLTPHANNGGTLEVGHTTNGDDIIRAGRLDLLHQAYIDAGAGYDTLEIEAKGYFAQPLALFGIEHVSIHNLPNIYSYGDGTPGDLGEFTYGRAPGDFPNVAGDDILSTNSIIDLATATGIEKLTLTESGYIGMDVENGSNGDAGSLTVAGIRNSAELNLEGGFNSDVNLFYGRGLTTDGIDIVLNNVDFRSALNIAHNANTFNITSTGGDNYLQNLHGLYGSTLTTINVDGDKHLHIGGNLADIYNAARLATFNAAENTAGVEVNFDGQNRILLTGSQGDDVINIADAEEVAISNASGANRYTVEVADELTIADGTGNNRYNLTAGDGSLVTVTAEGAGRNQLVLEGGEVDALTVDLDGDRNSVTVDTFVDEATIALGGENGMVFVEAATTVSVTAEGGRNTIDLLGENLSVEAGGNNNNLLLNGAYEGPADIDNGALLNINFTGTGNNFVTLGHPEDDRSTGVTALEGSVISGDSVNLVVLAESDLRAAELEGINSVVMNDTLILTVEQFLEIGAEAFASYRQIFGTFQDLHLIVSEDTDLTGVDLSSLREFNFDSDGNAFAVSGIQLHFHVAKGAELTLTAEQLHTAVATGGIKADDVGGELRGHITITEAGDLFDPWSTSDSYGYGGTIDGAFGTNNVTVVVSPEGFTRPEVVDDIHNRVINVTADDQTIDGLETLARTIEITGEGNLEFTDKLVAPNLQVLDFSSLVGNLNGLTIVDFHELTAGAVDTWGRIIGNNSDTRINVELDGDVGTAADGLISSGVETYVVTEMNGANREFWTCETTQDLLVLGLQGHYGFSITFGNVDHGVNFLLEAIYDKNNGSAAVGQLIGLYAREGATAVVNVVDAGGQLADGESILVEGITLVNAADVTVNVEGGNAIIQSIDIDDANSLTLNSADDVTILVAGDELDGLTTLDATGVAGNMTLVIQGTADLSGVNLSGIDTVVLEDGSELTLTIDQATEIGATNFVIASGDDAVLNLNDLNDQPFSLADYADGITVNVSIAELPEVTLHVDTDLTGFGAVEVHEITTLILTADQLVQLVTSGGSFIGEGQIVVTDFSQAHMDALGEWAAAQGDAFDFEDAFADTLARVTLQVDGDLALGAYTDQDFNSLDVEIAAALKDILRFELNGNQLTLGTAAQADELRVNNGDVKFTFVGAGLSIDMVAYTNIGEVEVYALLVNQNPNTEQLFLNLASSVQDLANVIRVVEDPEGLFVDRAIIINPGVTTATSGLQLVMPDASIHDQNIGNVWINLMGGSTLDGDIRLDRNTAKDNFFQTLTINSSGADTNVISGGIGADGSVPYGEVAAQGENNLLNIVINAETALEIEGEIVFQSVNPDATATLTLTGTADVTLKNLVTADADIINLVINTDDYTGTLTITGGSDSLELDATETLTFTGAADIVLDTDPANDGVDGGGDLQVINASTLTGDLTLGKVKDIHEEQFSFTSGTGVTSMTLIDSTLNSDPDTQPGWSFDFSSAAAGSVLEIGEDGTANTWTGGNLTIDLGGTTTLLISEDTDWTAMDLSILGNTAANPIVLAAGVELTLTAAQASELHIVAASDVILDPNQVGYDAAEVPQVNIIELGGNAVYDFSNIQEEVAGQATLADNIVELMAATDLGFFAILLDDEQLIGFASYDQANGRVVNTVNNDVNNNGNIAWTFDTLNAVVDASGYAGSIERLFIRDDLVITDPEVEQFWSGLHANIEIINIQYTGSLDEIAIGINRIFEVAGFSQLTSGLDLLEGEDLRFYENVTIKLGGSVDIDDLTLRNFVHPDIQNPDDVVFDTLRIESGSFDTTAAWDPITNVLAPQAWDPADPNLALPAGNSIGNISSGAGLNLTNVVLVTSAAAPSFGEMPLSVQTITFDGAEPGTEATLTIIGGEDVTLKAIDTSDVNIAILTVDTTLHTGTYTVTGGSPAAALGNTEVLNIDTEVDAGGGVDGEVHFGTAMDLVNGVPYAGVAGADLSEINIIGDALVNLGTIALIDGTDDGADPAFTLNGNGVDTTFARLGLANVDGNLVAPTLAPEQTWVFNDVDLTITEDVTFGADSNLVLNDVVLTIEGDVDLSEVNLSFTGVTLFVPAGETLTLTLDQINEADSVTGEGTVFVTGEINTDGAVNLNLANIQTVGVDLSGLVNVGVIVPQANDVNITLNAAGALNDADPAVPAGFNVVGSPYNDSITGSAEDDTFAMGAGDDTIDGNGGDDTYLVDADTDTIIGLETGDVLVVSAGATAEAAGIDEFIATAATINNGTAELSGAAGDSTIDVSLAGGSNGFTLTGNTGVANTILIGSNQADIINGGNAEVVNGDDVDELTGNGGADLFFFNVTISAPVSLASDTDVDGYDEEIWELADGFALDTAGDTITVSYTNNATNGSFIITNDGTIDFTSREQIGNRIAAELTTRGLAASYDNDADELTVTGTPGQSVEIINIVPNGDVGLFAASEIAASNDNDVAQEEIITVGDGTGGVVTEAGEFYQITVTLAGGTVFNAEYVANGTETEAQLATALAGELNAIFGGAVTANAAGNEITLEDQVPDNGGFTVSVAAAGGITGSGASVLLSTNPANLENAFADIITDFVSGVDTIAFEDVAAGTVANYVEAAAVSTFADALAAANAAFNGNVTYYLTSLDGTSGAPGEDQAVGLLFVDANGNTEADMVVRLVGIDESNFAFTDIVAA